MRDAYETLEEKDLREKREREESKRRFEREQQDLRRVLSLPEGRRTLWRILSQARVFNRCFTEGDPHQTSFNEGRRDIGLFVLGEIHQAKPDAYSQMQREAASETKREESSS